MIVADDAEAALSASDDLVERRGVVIIGCVAGSEREPVVERWPRWWWKCCAGSVAGRWYSMKGWSEKKSMVAVAVESAISALCM